MSSDLLRVLVVGLIAVPLAGAFIAAVLGSRRLDALRWLSLGTTLLTAVLALVLVVAFVGLGDRPANGTFRPEFVPGDTGQAEGNVDSHRTNWNLMTFGPASPAGSAPSIQFYLGIDGLNVWLVALTALLLVPSVLVSWNSIQERPHEFYAWLLVLEAGMLGVFLAFDIILFYVFFELTLVPLFFLIGIWGGPERRYAARKFFIYTLAGSVVLLLGLVGIVMACGGNSFSLPELVAQVNTQVTSSSEDRRLLWTALPSPSGIIRAVTGVEAPARPELVWGGIQFWIFLALTAGFAIKVPLIPFHTWLPLAHVEAPTAGSVLLAGVLLKIGTYGYLRMCLPFAPDACLSIGVPLIGTLAVIGIVYGAFCALAQDDVKKLVAYSSVSHLGFCMLGLFALNTAGLTGGVLQMINHGLSTGGLFLIVGMLYERYHTRKLAEYGGIGTKLRLMSCFMVFICLSSVGLPGLNGFVGEMMILAGAFEFQMSHGQWPTLAVVGSSGILLGAWYLLSMLRQVFFGPLKEPSLDGHGHGEDASHDHSAVHDLDGRELAALIPIAVACVLLGLFPMFFIKPMERDLAVVASGVVKAQDRVRALAAEAARAKNHDEAGIAGQ
jgi:NADH-quinone oxidoreductase subunit M